LFYGGYSVEKIGWAGGVVRTVFLRLYDARASIDIHGD
jgi:hypothetical protein